MYKITITSVDGTVKAEYIVKEYGYLSDEDIVKVKVVGKNDLKYVIRVPSVDRVAIEKII